METKLFDDKKLPYICTPLTGKTTDELFTELPAILSKNPDMIEWRVDFYEDINNTEKVLSTLEIIYKECKGIPLLFTIRSEQEGGQPIPLDEDSRVHLLTEVCKTNSVDIVDFEISNQVGNIKQVRDVSLAHNKKLILSHHNFECTPEKAEILKRLFNMEFMGADAAKVAVMPKSEDDVLTLLEVTKEAKETINIPIITISMGDLGMMSRMLGWYYGSALTFAVGNNSSAPGQIPIETLQSLIRMLKDPLGSRNLVTKEK
ncbi:type I 3-dehydroquinate dehydratase [Anaerobacillus sp. MEB173]|uniref:type I 3-dehydroquinate dehydratase n=1 Tax=Anaerobacillus sp. MEB173 TaxID=3383345 RepID=UPI003F920007